MYITISAPHVCGAEQCAAGDQEAAVEPSELRDHQASHTADQHTAQQHRPGTVPGSDELRCQKEGTGHAAGQGDNKLPGKSYKSQAAPAGDRYLQVNGRWHCPTAGFKNVNT